MSIGKKMGLGFGILLAFMATLAVVVWMHIDNMHRQFSSVIQHDAPAIANARHLLKLVVDMETGQRGFVITGKQEYLEPYERGRIEFGDLIRKEKAHVSENATQLKRLARIEASVQEWHERAASPEIAARRKVSAANADDEQVQELLAHGEDNRIIDQFTERGREIEVFFTDREDWEGAFAVKSIQKCMTDGLANRRGFASTGNEDFLEKFAAEEQKDLATLFATLKAIAAFRGHETALKIKIDQLEKLAAQWTDEWAKPEISARRMMNDHSETLQDVTAMVEIGTGKRILDRIRAEFQLFIDEENALMKKRFTAATLTANTTTRTTIVLTLISLIVGGGMAVMITLGITKPVHCLADALAMVAKGDLSQEIEIKSRDEIGELSRSFNQMVGDLRQLNQGRKRDEQALRGAKDYTDNIITSMIDMLVVVAPDGSIISINEATSNLLGYPEQELIGNPASLLFSEQDEEDEDDGAAPLVLSQGEIPLQKKVLRSLLKEGHFNNIELPLLAKDGHEIPSLLSGALMWDEQGEIRGIVCVARDITEHKKAETALRTSEIRSRTLLEGSPVCNKIIDLDSRLLYMSAAGINQLKIPDINLLYGSTYPAEIYPESIRAPFLQPLQRAIAGEESRVECPLLDADGNEVWYDTTFVPARDNDGQIVYVIATSVNTTERKRAEEALRRSETLSSRAQAIAHLGSFEMDVARDRMIWSDEMFQIHGIGRNEFGGTIRDVMVLIHPEDRGRVRITIEQIMKTGTSTGLEYRIVRPDGESRTVFAQAESIAESDETNNRLIGFVQDITERTKAEDETRNLQAQLRHAQKMDAIGQLATGVAHEFNNALVGIRGNAELMLNMPGDVLTDAIRQPLKDIERSGVRAYEITQQLLSFARKKNHHMRIFDVNQMVLDSHQMLQRLIGTRISLTTQLDADPAYVRADQSELEQALMNLVINARDAMPSGGDLSIRTCVATLQEEGLAQHCEAGRFVQLSVADVGCGMSPETVERIFEPFFTTKSVGKGTGLGLSTLYSDIANSDGFVSVQSQQGKGTVIDVHLPLSQQSAVVEKAETEPSEIADTSGGETILVCDDEEIVLASVSALLKSVGYRVIATSSGKEALVAADAHAAEISLLITDLTMPDMDGVELGKEIRRQHPQMKIIYSSGHAADYVELCAQNKHIEILEKGRSSNEMFRRIRAVLDKDDPDDPDDTTISKKAG